MHTPSIRPIHAPTNMDGMNNPAGTYERDDIIHSLTFSGKPLSEKMFMMFGSKMNNFYVIYQPKTFLRRLSNSESYQVSHYVCSS